MTEIETSRPEGRELAIQVAGMTCAACVRHVEKALRKAPGVRDVRVNLASERADLVLGPEADLGDLAARLKDEGYEARVGRYEIGVGGMTCASCVAHVEKALRKIPGVLSASVNLASERAFVEALAGDVDYAALAQAVREAGYEPRKLGGDGPDPLAVRAAETAALRRKFLIAAALALPVIVLEMGGHMSPGFTHALHGALGHPALAIIPALLTTAVLFWPGRRFFTLGFASLLRGSPDMNALVALGAGAAYAYSLLATFAPALLPEGTRHSYFESAAAIVTLILLGRWLEARARGRAADAIGRLARLQPKIAHVRRDGASLDLPVDEVRAGDFVDVRPGETAPVDGMVIEGASHVDESLMTGESAPVPKTSGDPIIGGSLNLAGAFTLKAEKVGGETVLAGIVRMVESAQGARLPIQALADRVTAIFVPVVLALALATCALWLWLGPQPALALALVSAVNVLIIACPCAMGLATPAALMTGTGRAAELGVIFRQGDALQTLCGVRTVAFDKTGTLTLGKPTLTQIHAAPSFDEARILALAAAVEAKSEHPLGRALAEAAHARGLALPEVSDFAYRPGLGVTGLVDGQKIGVGSADLLAALGADPKLLEPQAEIRAGQGASCFFISIDGQAAGLFAVADPVRPEAAAAIAALHALGLKTALVTGDREATAQAVAALIKVDRVFAGMKPDGKVAALKALRADGPVAFVGDGVNDAPALAAADVGIAMGAGTDIAIDSAQVILMSSDLAKVAQAFALSRATLRNIKQNLFWAFGYNVVLIPVAMGALYPLNGTLLNPALGAAAMALSSLFVLANALRLRRFVPKSGAEPAAVLG
jgi:Cu+-exporting ATPase